MYPVITIRWIHIEMTGLWVVLWIMVMLLSIRSSAKKEHIKFQDFFFHLPIMIILTYGLGSYMIFLLSYRTILPPTIKEIIQILLPLNYQFYASGIIIWLLVSIIIFVYQFRTKILRKKRLDIIYKWIMLWMIIVWIFLVLGDNMIGLITNSRIWVSAMTPHSEVAKFSAVYPVWLWISISAIISLMISMWYLRQKIAFWRSIPWWWTFLIGLWWTLIFQNHIKYGAIYAYNMIFDLNQYILRSLWIMILLYHYRRKSKRMIQSLTRTI